MAEEDIVYTKEEGSVRMYIKGKPVFFEVPTALQEEYDPKGDSSPPSKALKLEWVYGYRGRDCRCNIFLLPSGEIVYFVGAVAVLYHLEEGTQRHYIGHTDDIKCIAVHPEGQLVATGQTKGHGDEAMPHIRVWDRDSLETLHVLGMGEFEKPVGCLSFSISDGGATLAAVEDGASSKMLTTWNWADEAKVAEGKCGVDEVITLNFSGEDTSIVSSGKNHISFWSYEDGALEKKNGIFGNNPRPKFVTAIAYLPSGELISGDTNGNLFKWEKGGNNVDKVIEGAHDGAILTIYVKEDGSMITGGTDAKVVEWSADLEKTDNNMELDKEYGNPRVVLNGADGASLVVGTTKNCILVGEMGGELTPIIQGHTDELWALGVHPSEPHFLTAAEKIFLRDATTHKPIWVHDIDKTVRSAAFSGDGETIVLGTTCGKWVALSSETRDVLTEKQNGDEPIQVVTFSPDGKCLAVGSRDNSIYVYSCEKTDDGMNFEKVGRCTGHSSFITHLDWSSDNQFLRSNSGDYELLYWDATECSQKTSVSDMCDTEWATHSCVLAFNSIGIWPEDVDGTDINTITRSWAGDLLATGDDFGKVRLFAAPAHNHHAPSEEYGGHSSHVTDVGFLSDDSFLISAGGNDTAVMQWSVE
ncbi:unnamed protein product [Meganyctiphanes norvegica]|uniref:Echinoderm microtubule-associated protein-like 2 n=1 Tax=Meganyctiphanes norvegica TaxID=48144 RepID=A0AAV2PYZ9_MEGNR